MKRSILGRVITHSHVLIKTSMNGKQGHGLHYVSEHHHVTTYHLKRHTFIAVNWSTKLSGEMLLEHKRGRGKIQSLLLLYVPSLHGEFYRNDCLLAIPRLAIEKREHMSCRLSDEHNKLIIHNHRNAFTHILHITYEALS